MTTYSNLIEEVLSNLRGLGSPDKITSLGSALDTTQTQLTVADSSSFGAGIAEIDMELVYVTGVDQQSDTLTLATGFGRGYGGTPAATHSVGAQVTMSPAFPRSKIAREINNVIRSLYPHIYAVKNAPTFLMDAIATQFVLPIDAEFVVDVNYYDIASLAWQRSTVWETQQKANATAYAATGKYLNLWDPILSGATVQITYAAEPATLVNLTDDFHTVTGLDDNMSSVVVLGVLSKLVQFAELNRIPMTTASAQLLAEQGQIGVGTTISRDLRQQFQQAIQSEQLAQSRQFPPRVHRTR